MLIDVRGGARIYRAALIAPGVWWLELAVVFFFSSDSTMGLAIVILPYAAGMLGAGAGLWSQRLALRRFSLLAELAGLGLGAFGGFLLGAVLGVGGPDSKGGGPWWITFLLWAGTALSLLCVVPAFLLLRQETRLAEPPASSGSVLRGAAKVAAGLVALGILLAFGANYAQKADRRARWKRQGEESYRYYKTALERRGLAAPAAHSKPPVLLGDPGSCPIELHSVSRSSAAAGEEVEMTGRWGQSQGDKLPGLRYAYLDLLDVVSWSDSVVRVRIPRGIRPGNYYELVVFCGLQTGNPYSTVSLPFEVLASTP